MTYEFIQVTCTKLNGDFIICSNLSMMDHQKLSPQDAVKALEAIAVKAQADGFSVEWTREKMDSVEIEIYGDLFTENV